MFCKSIGTVGVALALSGIAASAGPASAAPPETILSRVVPGGLVNCPFDVQFTVVGEPQSEHFTVGPHGTKMIYGGTHIDFTNLSNGNTLRLTDAANLKTGSVQPDGTTPASVSGSFLVISFGDIPGLAPGIYDFVGHLTWVFTPSGDIVQPSSNGRSLDICSALA